MAKRSTNALIYFIYNSTKCITITSYVIWFHISITNLKSYEQIELDLVQCGSIDINNLVLEIY